MTVWFELVPLGPKFGACVTLMLWPRKAKNRNIKVPTNSPLAATKWFFKLDRSAEFLGWRKPPMGMLKECFSPIVPTHKLSHQDAGWLSGKREPKSKSPDDTKEAQFKL